MPDPMEVIHVDLWSFGVGDNKKQVLTMIDRATRWVEATEVKTKSTKEFVSRLFSIWISRYGLPKIIVSDNENLFTSDYATEITRLLGIKPALSCIYHPEGNAPIESFHRTFHDLMAIVMNDYSLLDFDEAIQLALMSYRATIHDSLKETPAYMLMGLDMCWPEERDLTKIIDDVNRERLDFFKTWRQRLLKQSYLKNLDQVTKRNEDRTEVKLKFGDLVLVREREAGKLDPSWTLPWRVVVTRGDADQQVFCKSLYGKEELKWFHVQNLRRIMRPRGPQLEEWLSALMKSGLSSLEAKRRLLETVLDQQRSDGTYSEVHDLTRRYKRPRIN